MNNSAERIQFITDYIVAYENKIKLLNKNGLFDNAKLFELFSIEVGSLYFGQKVSNLNMNTYTYPCVDLITEDKQTFIQVSTTQNIPAKIKETLKSIKASKNDDINAITSVKFIVLNNNSVEKVKDYTGNSQIGNIPFVRVSDLITTREIIQKATNELKFQIALYDLFKKESESILESSDNLRDAFERSKLGLNNIECKINGEYAISRNKLINKIELDNHKNISVQGGAGSGKSALCKMLIENEELFLYARAEKLVKNTNINDIWDFNIKRTLKYLSDKPILFFIDALEFIADHPMKPELLQELYEYTKKYPNVKIITSCRTSDKNAFIRIEGMYSVYSYEVPELTPKEQSTIADSYLIIKKMLGINTYTELLKSPFYINLIISKIDDIDKISNENELRKYIWRNIICLNINEIEKIVESIVLERAKKFLLDVDSMNHPTEIIKRLISEDVLVQNEKNIRLVRLKYDIFEDICFEQYLDNEFDKCKGNYDEFFTLAETLGRCIYRRYQIWTSNKLLARNNREKFLYELIFSDKMPQKWRKQTLIGLVKSRYCELFFDEYGQAITKNGLLNDFIKTTNLYSFEIANNEFTYRLSYIKLTPIGKGRGCLIRLIIKNKLYENNYIQQSDLIKLCVDFAKIRVKDKQIANSACFILEYFVDKYMTKIESEDYYKLDDVIIPLLVPIYQMAEYSFKWIINFWQTMIVFFKNNSRRKEVLAEKIIKNTLKFEHTMLAKYLPSELCELAETFWTYVPSVKNQYDYHNSFHDTALQYGLNKHVEQYQNESYHDTPITGNFFYCLFKLNFWIGIDWAIDFFNKAILYFAKEQSENLASYEINFIDDNVKRGYFGFAEMWLVATRECRMPTLINDLIYCIKAALKDIISYLNHEDAVEFANNVKNCILEKSNNIALLTVIVDIGVEFRYKIPGLALDLTTNISIILHDLEKSRSFNKSSIEKALEEKMFLAMGMSSSMLPDRYDQKTSNYFCLLEYVRDAQLYGEKGIKSKCHNILDYLYSITLYNENIGFHHTILSIIS